MKKTLIKKLSFFGEVFFGLILALVIVVSVFPLIPPFKNYYHSRTVLTGSMEPKVPKGSVVINQWADQKNLKVGDVITYQHSADGKIIYITHRIVKIDKTGALWRFETRGDANPSPDVGLVTQAGTEGKVILTIPFIGYLIEFFKTLVGFTLLVALPLLLFIVQQTRDVLKIWKRRKSFLPLAIEPVTDSKLITKPMRRKSAKRKNRKVLMAMFLACSCFTAKASFVTYAAFTSEQTTITSVTLNTAASFDSVPPVITNISHFIGTPNLPNEMIATISWDTDEPATSNLEWRVSLSVPWTVLSADLTADQTSHQRAIPNLIADTTYYFLIRSSDTAGNESTAEGSFKTDNERWGITISDIVINEYLPNPSGADNALMPAGEWVELYNRGFSTVNLADWYLTDSNSSHRLPITLVNTISSNPITTDLNLAPGEFLVVYRNGDSDFALNNVLGDSVILRVQYGQLADIHVYSVILGDTILENKTFARFPDGSSNWFDPIPSPNGPNVLEENPIRMPDEIKPESPTPTASNAATPTSNATTENVATSTPTASPELNPELSASSSATTVETSLTPTPSEPTSEPSITLSFAPTGEPEPALSPSPTPSPEISLTPTPSSTLEVISPTPMPTAELSPSPSPILIPTSPPDTNPEPTSTPVPTSESTPTLTPALSLESEQ